MRFADFLLTNISIKLYRVKEPKLFIWIDFAMVSANGTLSEFKFDANDYFEYPLATHFGNCSVADTL